MHVRRLLATLLLCGPFTSSALAEAVTPVQSWQGSAEKGESATTVPKSIFTAEQFATAWKLCERTDPLPQIDFTKHVALVETTTGGRINLRASLNDKGELLGLGISTRDIRPGFRYVLAVFPREKVKSVNGVEVPK